MSLQGYRVVYSGRVQGVGFRYRAVEIARNFSVSGWVKNLSTGQVELWAEGNEEDVIAFLNAIRATWGTFIRDERIDSEPATGIYASFDVMF